MTSAQPIHPVRLRPPFFQSGEQAALLRYLDADFIARFQQDVQQRRFEEPQFGQWISEDTRASDRHPVLRLPTHRAFHVVCCEVICERFGRPPLDPTRITSAGFVIRRRRGGGEQAWVLEQGEALGWQAASDAGRDPDLDRRLCANGVLHARANRATYSGEQTHPLHVLTSHDEQGQRHTLLFGYVPLGGFYYERQEDTLFDPDSRQQVEQFAARSLPWPFGYRDGSPAWTAEHSWPIQRGVPSSGCFEWLRLLVQRYHLGEAGRDDNQALEQLGADIWFYRDWLLPHHVQYGGFHEQMRDQFKPARRFSLTQYLRDCFARSADNPLVPWISRQEAAADRAGGLERLASLEPLPQADGDGELNLSLRLSAADAEDLRHQLGQRFRRQTLTQAREIPLPKFTQGAGDLYQILPFVRAKNDQGKEQIHWADRACRSLQFRVAAPFDPEASRPSLIPMPGLKDLKRGLAKGASILTPGDTFDLINGLNLKKGASEDVVGSGPKFGIQWICSFSLPVITLVAMILLMIMISLLNIVFFWLPWVRICLPFPKIDK
ncbi:MAG: hypothetical protein SV765_05940 [Pseudomonadota bacterium]|nr:hypothetical protein [Pseudomonadota bacterium]